MIRLLGFLVGSAASVGVILLLLGVPDFQSSAPVVADRIVAISTPSPEEPLEPFAEMATESPAQRLLAEPLEASPLPVSEDGPVPEVSLLAEEIKWHSFWNPFRSEIAANGFVSQLEEVTGFDFRVVKIKTGVYEVAFAYEDDIERHNKLSQIASATGLELAQ